MDYTFTFDQVRQAAEQAVRDRGQDYVYEYLPNSEVCLYSHSGEPGCIVGQIIFNLSPELFNRLREIEENGYSDDEPSSFSAGSVPYRLGITLSHATQSYLNDLQSEQDNRSEWGRALRIAEETHLAMVADQAWLENGEYDELKVESGLQ